MGENKRLNIQMEMLNTSVMIQQDDYRQEMDSRTVTTSSLDCWFFCLCLSVLKWVFLLINGGSYEGQVFLFERSEKVFALRGQSNLRDCACWREIFLSQKARASLKADIHLQTSIFFQILQVSTNVGKSTS